MYILFCFSVSGWVYNFLATKKKLKKKKCVRKKKNGNLIVPGEIKIVGVHIYKKIKIKTLAFVVTPKRHTPRLQDHNWWGYQVVRIL